MLNVANNSRVVLTEIVWNGAQSTDITGTNVERGAWLALFRKADEEQSVLLFLKKYTWKGKTVIWAIAGLCYGVISKVKYQTASTERSPAD